MSQISGNQIKDGAVTDTQVNASAAIKVSKTNISSLDANLVIGGDASSRSVTVGSASKIGTVRDTVKIGSATPSRVVSAETTDILIQSATPLTANVTSVALNTLTGGASADALHTHTGIVTNQKDRLTTYTATSAAGGTDFIASTLLTVTTWTFDLGVVGRPLELEPTVVLTDLIAKVYVNGILRPQSEVVTTSLSNVTPALRKVVLTTDSLAPQGAPSATVVTIELIYRTA